MPAPGVLQTPTTADPARAVEANTHPVTHPSVARETLAGNVRQGCDEAA